jgi:hypothetical protein
MPSIESAKPQALETRVWKDLAQLAVEAMAIGVVFSVLLALAVFVVARSGRGDDFSASQPARVEARADASTG